MYVLQQLRTLALTMHHHANDALKVELVQFMNSFTYYDGNYIQGIASAPPEEIFDYIRVLHERISLADNVIMEGFDTVDYLGHTLQAFFIKCDRLALFSYGW